MKPTLILSATYLFYLSVGSVRAETAEDALQSALALEKQGQLDQAVAACDRALETANLYWLQPALFTKAKVCLSAGCRDEAIAAIHRLHTEYPESASTVRAGILEAQLAGADPNPAQAAYQRELEAGKLVDEAVKLADANEAEQSLSLLAGVTRDYPDSAAALRALDAQGHLLVRLSRRKEAIPVFATLLLRTVQTTPNAQIVQRARTRLGVLCRGSGRITEAEDIFAALAREGNNPAVASRASLQLIGIQYERIRTPVFVGRAKGTYDERQADRAGWAALRQKCQELIDAPWCQSRERARAELTQVESYCWEDDVDGAVRAGTAFTCKYGGSPFMDELVHCRLFVGVAMGDAGRYQEALEQFQWIRQHAPQVPERAWFELWYTLDRLHAPPEQIQEVEDILMKVDPDCSSSRYIKLINRQRAQSHVSNIP